MAFSASQNYFATMFWKYNLSSSVQIESVLAKEDVTLQELMDEEDIINECKVQNKVLMEFLTKPNIIEELVTLTSTEPSVEMEERTRFKYCNIACEILTCDVPAINERLASDQNLLAKLYTFFDNDPPLNPLLASFVSKIMGVLITKKTEQNWLSYQLTCLQVLDFLKAKENFVTLLLKHLGTSAIMDLTLKLMTQVKGEEVRQDVLNWLDGQGIMQSLVSLLDPSVDKEIHSNVAQLLCDFIKISRDNLKNSTERNDPDPLFNTLESPSIISLLLDHILSNPKTDSCIIGGIQVLLTLLDVNKVLCDEVNDADQKRTVVQNVTSEILKRLQDFHDLLVDPPKKTPINTATGVLDPPFGNTRLHVTKLLATIISTDNSDLLKELVSLGTMQVLLNHFFAFPWNNFLHAQVQVCIASALKAHIPSETGNENALYKHLIVNCKLVERILEAWNDNDVQTEKKGVRQGYMGHLTNIACNIAELCSSSDLGQFLKDNLPEIATNFEEFSQTTLEEVKKTRETLLAGVHPNAVNEDNDEYGDVPFSQSSLLHQQLFTQYQVHQLAPQVYIENYGFNDDEFNSRDALHTIDHRTGMNFDLSEGDLVQQHEMFKEVCAQNINTLDDADDQIFEDRDHTFQTVIEKQGERHAAAYSSDSDDDSPPPEDPFMDVDPWESANMQSESAVAPISIDNPWNANEENALEASTGWANFSSPSFANFEANFEPLDTVIPATEAASQEPPFDPKLIENLKIEIAQIVCGVTDNDKSSGDLQLADTNNLPPPSSELPPLCTTAEKGETKSLPAEVPAKTTATPAQEGK